MTQAYKREILSLFERQGVTILDQWFSGGGHWMVKATHGAGERVFTLPNSTPPGNNHRFMQRIEGDLKRFVREFPLTAMQAAIAKAKPKQDEFKIVRRLLPTGVETNVPPGPIIPKGEGKVTMTATPQGFLNAGKSPEEKPAKAPIHKLKAAEMYKLTKWIEGLPQEELTTYKEVAAKASALLLGVPVSDSSVATACESVGRKTNTRTIVASKDQSAQIKVMAGLMCELWVRVYGEPAPQSLKEMI